jgi:rod shape-determining protein MreB
VVAVNTKTGDVVAIGEEARKMIGRTPGNITIIRPLKNGVIADFQSTAAMLKYFISKTKKYVTGLFPTKPSLVICTPCGVTQVERRAIQESALKSGAKEVFIVEEPLAAAIGANLPVSEAVGSMVVDIGGGTTEVAVLSLGGIVTSRSLRIGGDTQNFAIMEYIRKKHNLMIGEKTAEQIKFELGSAWEPEIGKGSDVRGRDMVTGLPATVEITTEEIYDSLKEPVEQILDVVKLTLESCPPELSGDIMEQGIVLTGGGALLKNMVTGVSEGYSKSLELVGVGYRAAKQGKKLVLTVGYSHPVEIEAAEGIEFDVPAATQIVVKGIDKEQVGQIAAIIRDVRRPEPYKGKGIKYSNEVIRRKEGKTGKK